MSQDTSDNIYVNISVTNPNIGINNPVQAVYNVSYDNNILDRPSDYYFSIASFQVPLNEIPLFVMPIVAGQPDPNLTPYIVGVCQQQNATAPPAAPPPPANGMPSPTATNFPVSVEYWPQDEDIAGNPGNALYYYVYNYGHISDMFNYALNRSWQAAGSPGGAGACPYMIWNENQKIYQIVMPDSFVTATASAGFHWTVFFNYAAFYPISSFNSVQNNGRFEIWNANYATDNSVIASPPIGTNDRTTTGAAYIYSQEWSTYDYINSVRKLVMTSSTIPLQKEYYPSYNNNVNGGSNANTVGIITDFNLDLTEPGQQRSVAIYSPPIYRLADLISDSPLRKIDVSFWWVDRLNQFYPLYLSQYDAITMKLAFFNKRLYRNQQLKYL